MTYWIVLFCVTSENIWHGLHMALFQVNTLIPPAIFHSWMKSQPTCVHVVFIWRVNQLILQLFAHFKNEKLSDYTCIQKHVIPYWSLYCTYSYLILDPLTCEVRSLTPFSVILSKPCTNHSNMQKNKQKNLLVTVSHEKIISHINALLTRIVKSVIPESFFWKIRLECSALTRPHVYTRG